MKRPLIPFLALALLYVTATAQGEWKWAHYWSGGDGSYNDYYNYITNTAFDDEGNIYVYGSMGGSAVIDGNTFQFTTNAEVLSHNEHSVLLAKFDTLGNMLWHKEMRCVDEIAVPKWMEVRDNKVFVAANCGFHGSYADSWLYYWDTLIVKNQINAMPQEEQNPPFKTGCVWTCLAQFDLDGNLLEDLFFETLSRDTNYGHRRMSTLSQNTTSPDPVHLDNEGNYYIFTPIQYYGVESAPYTILVYGDSNRTYDLYMPGNADPTCTQSCLNNAMLYKFSPDGNLLFAKPLVEGTDGIAPSYNTCDTINRYFYTYFEGMSFDEDDNMYVSGYVRLAQHLNGQGGELHDYPVHIWWDSTHCLTMNDISSAACCNFIIKYDTSGNVVWINQVYSRGASNPNDNSYAFANWYGNVYCSGNVYILGNAAYKIDSAAMIYFDEESNSLQRYHDSFSDIGFFVRLDATTGHYFKQGIVPYEQAVVGERPAVLSNRIFAYSSVNHNSEGIIEWTSEGEFININTITSLNPLINRRPSVNMNERGYLLIDLNASGVISFDDNVVANCPEEHSNAVFALYHDPRFAEPFVPDDTVDIVEYQHNRESDIYLYPNPTNGEAIVCGYMYDYRSIELFDLQGRKLADLAESHDGTSLPIIDLTPYPAGTYLVRINFNRGVSVTRKVVKGE